MASDRARVAGPDFICVGMPKAGTGWLFDQLNTHPDFWMPPIKGVHYLRYDFPAMTNATKRLIRSSRSSRARRAKGRAEDDRDYEFLVEASALAKQPRNLERYASLFRHKGESLSGDITAAYADLRENVISEIGKALPDVKIILLIRDPIARAWSRISMAYRAGQFDVAILEQEQAFRAYLRTSNFIADERSFPTKIVERWAQAAPHLRFRHFLFDDIESKPEQARRDILLYLGGDPEKKSGELAAGHNHKAAAVKLVLTDRLKAILVDHFKDEVRACAQFFEGPARGWLARYGL
jgi:hypothetical protein